MLSSNDLIEECGQSIQMQDSRIYKGNEDAKSKLGSQLYDSRTIPIMNTVSLKDLQKMEFTVQLFQIPCENQEKEEKTQKQDQLLSQSWQKRCKKQTLSRRYSKLHKVETNGSLHIFLLTKEIGTKKYSTVESRFSPLPIMPTQLLQDFFQFRLLKGQKAHLDCPLDQKQTPELIQFKQRSCARLCSRFVNRESLQNVTFALMNRIYCIDFRWFSELISSGLEDPKILNSESEFPSKVKILVDSKASSVTSSHVKDFSFYTIACKNRMLIAIVPTSGPFFKLRCLTLDYFSNYMQIQESTRIICSSLQNLITSQVPLIHSSSAVKANPELKKSNSPLNDLSSSSDKIALSLFESQMDDHIQQHQLVVKENVSLIMAKHSEVMRRKEELDSKKNEVDQLLQKVFAKNKESLLKRKEAIIAKNESINKKLFEIASLLNKGSTQSKTNGIPQMDVANVEMNEGYSKKSELYYERLKNVSEQYQKYFEKRQDFFETIGDYTNPNCILDKSLMNRINTTTTAIQKHSEILDSQLAQSLSQITE